MKKSYDAPEFDIVKFADTAIMDDPFTDSKGETIKTTDPFDGE